MYPSSQNEQGGGDLEQRLRGLILNNATPNLDASATTPANLRLPPHMLSATSLEQQAYLAARNAKSDSQQMSKTPEHANQPPKKRLNQAQRRQMTSQLSIPIDPRPNSSTQSSRGAHLHTSNIPSSRISPQFGYTQPQHNQTYRHQQEHSPRFPGQGQPPSHSPRGPYPQGGPPQSSYQHGGGNLYQARQGPNKYQQQPPYHQNQQQSQGFRGPDSTYGRPPPQNRQLFQTGSYNGHARGRAFVPNPEAILAQSTILTAILVELIPIIGIDTEEISEKDAFRAVVEHACRESISQYEQQEMSNPEFDDSTVELRCFGSMSSGFATKASDMDLALLTPSSNPPADSSESPIPRILEKKLLSMGYGARLLTRTRVPIIKLCQKPTEKLLSDLLEAREKWEKGFVDEPEQEDAVAIEANGSGQEVESPKEIAFPSSIDSKAEATTQGIPSTNDQQLKLEQKENQSLADYYNSAKRLLRKTGGRDIFASSQDLTEKEGAILNDVCKAFIAGLKPADLVARLRSYHSISHLFDSSRPPLQRTLHGVWTQIEGEQFAMAFDNRPLTELREQRETECLAAVNAWRQLQDKSGPFIESLAYNKQLVLATDKLKCMSSLQLVLLKQIDFEEPTCYYMRAKKILDDLRGQEKSVAGISSIVVAHYVSGVNNGRVREQLQKVIEDTAMPDVKEQRHMLPQIQSETELNVVGLQHRALQVIMDYQIALEGGLFEEADHTHVKQYIALLRSRCLDGFVESSNVDLAFMEKINTLPDPTANHKPRDRYRDHLEFPKTDIGIQCDINFSADLALHNTLLLRCYSHCDPRVKLLILFVKHWAKIRGVNTPYRGSLSSYGYVLMVLHYLVNTVQPFVCPNLQMLHRESTSHLSPAEVEGHTTCSGRDVRFWRNEAEIKDLSTRGLLNHNGDSAGTLLRGFFEYFAHGGQMSTFQSRGFDWGREVLSLRTIGGILSKQEKGWVGAKTVTETTTIAAPLMPSTPASAKDDAAAGHVATGMETKAVKSKTVEEIKEIRHRYLFAIEDPFELDHNVARTVTHNGIVSIRDEFRRAWGIIQKMGTDQATEGLLDPVSVEDPKSGLEDLLIVTVGGNAKSFR